MLLYHSLITRFNLHFVQWFSLCPSPPHSFPHPVDLSYIPGQSSRGRRKVTHAFTESGTRCAGARLSAWSPSAPPVTSPTTRPSILYTILDLALLAIILCYSALFSTQSLIYLFIQINTSGNLWALIALTCSFNSTGSKSLWLGWRGWELMLKIW